MATELLTRKAATAYLAQKGLRVTVDTLREYATRAQKREKGPKFHRFGEKGSLTYYKPEELDEWVRSRLQRAR